MKRKRRFASFLLAMILVLQALPATAMASGGSRPSLPRLELGTQGLQRDIRLATLPDVTGGGNQIPQVTSPDNGSSGSNGQGDGTNLKPSTTVIETQSDGQTQTLQSDTNPSGNAANNQSGLPALPGSKSGSTGSQASGESKQTPDGKGDKQDPASSAADKKSESDPDSQSDASSQEDLAAKKEEAPEEKLEAMPQVRLTMKDAQGQPLEGATFRLRDMTPGQSSPAKDRTAKTDAKGLVTFPLDKGHSYELQEAQAPAGYAADPSTWTLTVSPQGQVTSRKTLAGLKQALKPELGSLDDAEADQAKAEAGKTDADKTNDKTANAKADAAGKVDAKSAKTTAKTPKAPEIQVQRQGENDFTLSFPMTLTSPVQAGDHFNLSLTTPIWRAGELEVLLHEGTADGPVVAREVSKAGGHVEVAFFHDSVRAQKLALLEKAKAEAEAAIKEATDQAEQAKAEARADKAAADKAAADKAKTNKADADKAAGTAEPADKAKTDKTAGVTQPAATGKQAPAKPTTDQKAGQTADKAIDQAKADEKLKEID